MTMYNARTKEEVKNIVENYGYELLNEYMNGKHRRVVIQDNFGYKYDVYLSHLMSGGIPAIAQTSNPFSLPNISLWLEIENKSFVLCKNNVYKGALEKLFFQCLKEECREIFEATWGNIYTRGDGCPFCVGQRVGKHNNLAYLRPELAAEWDYNKNEYNPEDYTEFANKEVSWICSKCGHPWNTTIKHRSNGNGCPKCANARKESKIANELKDYILSNYDSEDEYKILKNPETGRWLPYDIYIPYGEHPELNGFYIEVHWEQHYRVCDLHKMISKSKGTTSEEEFEYQKHKDGIKRRFARKNGTYIEIDLRKIKTVEEAIEHIEKVMENYSL